MLGTAEERRCYRLKAESGNEVRPFRAWVPGNFGKERQGERAGYPDFFRCFQTDIAHGESAGFVEVRFPTQKRINGKRVASPSACEMQPFSIPDNTALTTQGTFPSPCASATPLSGSADGLWLYNGGQRCWERQKKGGVIV